MSVIYVKVIFFQQHDAETEVVIEGWHGYKFVGDNIDKRVKPSRQRAEIKGQELHHFHGYAVRDRVDLSVMSDKAPHSTSPDADQFLPSNEDISALIEELTILVSRYFYGVKDVVDYVKYYSYNSIVQNTLRIL